MWDVAAMCQAHCMTRSGVLSAFLTLSVALPGFTQDLSIAEKVDAVFAEWDRPNSPGCALGVIRDGEFVYQNGYGMANLDWNIPIDPSTVFYIGSISKQFTAASVALLAWEGQIGLDDDIRKYFPEMPEHDRPVTVRHLIHHTSGVRDTYALMDLAGIPVANVFSNEEALDLILRQHDLNFQPGDEYLYSNGGYVILAKLIERVTGKSLQEYAREKIFEPLGMEHTHFHDDPRHIVKRRAMSYGPTEDGGFEQSYLGNFNKVGAGGLYSTVDDLLMWSRNFYDSRIGGAGFIDTLLTHGVLNDGDTLDYAFALVETEYKGLRSIGHGGSMMGFKADFIQFPEERFSVVCLCNLGTIDPGELTRRVADIYLTERFRVTLEPFEGNYVNRDLDVVYTIDFRDGNLFLQRPAAPAELMEPSGEDEFGVYGSWQVAFSRDASQRVTGFSVEAGRATGVDFVRIEATAAHR